MYTATATDGPSSSSSGLLEGALGVASECGSGWISEGASSEVTSLSRREGSDVVAKRYLSWKVAAVVSNWDSFSFSFLFSFSGSVLFSDVGSLSLFPVWFSIVGSEDEDEA